MECMAKVFSIAHVHFTVNPSSSLLPKLAIFLAWNERQIGRTYVCFALSAVGASNNYVDQKSEVGRWSVESPCLIARTEDR